VGPYRVLSSVNEIAKALSTSVGLEVLLVAEAVDPLRLGNGLVIRPDVGFDGCPDLGVLVVPGGSSQSRTAGRRVEQRNPKMIEFIRRHSDSAEITGSVCTGAFLLAEAGILAGRRANTHWMYRGELEDLMASRGEQIEVVPERVVWDGRVVTGGGVTSGIDLGLEIIERLFSSEVRSAVESALEIHTPD
jgi:cyclohexyl-isocyanide hydratase